MIYFDFGDSKNSSIDSKYNIALQLNKVMQIN